MINLPKEKLLLLALALLLILFFVFNYLNQSQSEEFFEVNDKKFSSEFIEDEIEPFCNGIKSSSYKFLKLENIKKLNISFVNKEAWYRNLLETLESDPIILDKNKKRYKATIEIEYDSGIKCIFDSKIRLSGDFQDHIRNNLRATSMDISLDNGNIENIVKFKLFLPETRRENTEYVITAIMKNLNFLTPRTQSVNVSINNEKEVNFI